MNGLNIAERDQALNAQVLKGDILPAFEEFYADDVVMQENSNPPTVGKAACRAHEHEFVSSIKVLHRIHLGAVANNGDHTFSEWQIDATYEDGSHKVIQQVAVRQWRDRAPRLPPI